VVHAGIQSSSGRYRPYSVYIIGILLAVCSLYCQGRYSQIPHSIPGSTFSKLLRKISHLRTILDNMWLNSNLLLHDLTTTPRNNVRHDAKINMLITIIIALLFPIIRDYRP